MDKLFSICCLSVSICEWDDNGTFVIRRIRWVSSAKMLKTVLGTNKPHEH